MRTIVEIFATLRTWLASVAGAPPPGLSDSTNSGGCAASAAANSSMSWRLMQPAKVQSILMKVSPQSE